MAIIATIGIVGITLWLLLFCIESLKELLKNGKIRSITK